jgi:hypothetical protein
MWGQGEKDEIGLVAQAGGIEIAEDEGGEPPEVRIGLVEPLAGQTLRGHHGQLQLRVHAEQTKGFPPPCTPLRPRHRDAKHGAYRLEYWNLDAPPADRTSCALSYAGRV